MRHATLILNGGATGLDGAAEGVTPAALCDLLRQQGTALTVQRVGPGALAGTLRSVVAQRPDAVLVGGGDGTVSTAARFLAGTDLPLGVLPLGSLNHFARDLGLSGDWREAVTLLPGAATRRVDVAEVNGRVFINNCSLGSYAEAVRRRELLRRRHGHGKWFAMWLASVAVFRRLRRMRLRIELRETTLDLRTPFVVIANNRYTGHVLDERLRPQLDEGRLWIYTTRAHRRLTLLRLFWQSFARRIDAAEALETHSVTDAAVTAVNNRPIPIALDGELADVQPPLRFRIRPRALRVLAPPTAPS